MSIPAPPLHPTVAAGDLDSVADPGLWEAFTYTRGSAVAAQSWLLATRATGLASPERLTLLGLAIHVDLSLAGDRPYEGTRPGDLRVFTGLGDARLRALLKWLAEYGWCELVQGSRPARYMPHKQVAYWARLTDEAP